VFFFFFNNEGTGSHVNMEDGSSHFNRIDLYYK